MILIDEITRCVRGPSQSTNRKLVLQNEKMDAFMLNGFTWRLQNDITRRRLVNGALQQSSLDQIFVIKTI